MCPRWESNPRLPACKASTLSTRPGSPLSERFFRSNRPGYPHPVSSELENCGIRVAVGDCSVTERRRWRPPYQTGKTVHVHANHYKHNEDGRTAPGVCDNGSVPLSHSGNVVTRIGIHTHTHEPFIAGCTYGEQVCSHFRKGNNFLLASLDNGTFSYWVLL